MSEEKPIIEQVEERREKEKKKKEKEEKLLDKVDEWEEEGWDVSKLKPKIKDDLEHGEELIEEYEGKIGRLKRINERYHSLPLDKFDLDTGWLENNLDDPDAVDKLEKEVSELEKKIKEIRKRNKRKRVARKKRKEYLEKVNEWKEEGFKVDRLIRLLKEDFEKGEEKYKEYEENIDELKLLRKKYYSLDTTGRDFDTVEIEHKLDDPTAVDELREMIEGLGERKQRPPQQVQTKQEVSYEKEEKVSPEPNVFTLDSAEDWLDILKNQRRNAEMFQKVRGLLKEKAELEESLIDYLETEPDLRGKFLHYIKYWNKNISDEDEVKYFKILDDEKDFKVIKIYSTSPFIGCLYGVGVLLEEEKVGISKSTHPHMFFEEYLNKLYGDKSDEWKEKEEDNNKIYYF